MKSAMETVEIEFGKSQQFPVLRQLGPSNGFISSLSLPLPDVFLG